MVRLISDNKYEIYNNLIVTATCIESAEQVDAFVKHSISYKPHKFDFNLATDVQNIEKTDKIKNQSIAPILNCLKALLFINHHSFHLHDNIKAYFDLAIKSEEILKENSGKKIQLENWENNWINIIKYWITHDKSNLNLTFVENSRINPNDLLNFRVGMVFALYTGSKTLLNTLQANHSSLEANLNNPYFIAIQAFVFEELGDFETAEKLTKTSLELDSTNVWAQHVLAHIYYSTNRIEQCAEFLETNRPNWQKDGNTFISKHITWHLAITYLELNEFDKASSVLDDIIYANFEEAECPLSFLGYIIRVFIRQQDLNHIKRNWVIHLLDYLKNPEIYTKHLLFDCLAIWFISFIENHFNFTTQERQEFKIKDILEICLKKIEKHSEMVDPKYGKEFFMMDYQQLIKGMVYFGKMNYKLTVATIEPYIDSIKLLGASDEQLVVMYEVMLFSYYQLKDNKNFDIVLNKYFRDFKDFHVVKKMAKDMQDLEVIEDNLNNNLINLSKF